MKRITMLLALLISVVSFSTYANAEEVEVKDLESYAEYIKSAKLKGEVWDAYPTNQGQMNYLMQLLYTKAPSKVMIKSKDLSRDEIKEMLINADRAIEDLEKFPMRYGLLSYSVAYGPDYVILYSSSSTLKKVSGTSIISGVDKLTTSLAEQLKGETDYESIKNVSSYIHENISYTNQGWKLMTIANLHNGQLGCQGITYLGKLILNKMGIETQTRLGESHYWLVAKTAEGQEVTVDPTTDILLGTKNITLGTSTEEHIYLTNYTNLFTAKFEENKYTQVVKFVNPELTDMHLVQQ